MFASLAPLLRLFRAAPATGADLPHLLLESAEARAGLDPRQAQELRSAACAALRVVR